VLLLSVLAAASGDGIVHELLNGLAVREDADQAMKIPVVPIPTGRFCRSTKTSCI
jgi:sphingosine kinase